ncbi:hypothetical protein F5Y00DRAFT_261721 [Daldinia vernicosa]|uniref:uncharacterized protein n=1 Tax=Daldinia vernicosa TaxID=114800 RepID=UPI002008B02D|nr:uncharacterized protein F5Y00DRAFT_261721 [Daldinia vernicosa]KAI0849251.1 hypothetical protein F5Y00DRAFT_261721 [Daldinia vernicosa]
MANVATTKKTGKAKVQWWDNRDMYILCPWCKGIHRHGFNANYSQRHRRVPHCDSIDLIRKLQYLGYNLYYEIQFPASPADTFEIDKDNLRFVAGGARVPDDDEGGVPADEADRMRADFRKSIEEKRKWTEAIETVIIFEDLSIRRITKVVSEMVLGNVEHVREYLKSSSEADIFLRGVESWKRQDYTSNNESTEDSTAETSGETALHMAACESSSEMVKLLLLNGADVNATDCDGRTALMEAALWGRRENVEVLLNGLFDNSGRLWCAADFAKPLKQNVEARRMRSGRDKDREDIVFLLEDAADEPGPLQLDGFVYQRPPNDPTMLSLTTRYSLPNEWKTVAHMIRGGGLPDIAAMSGWSHAQSETIHVAGRDWTDAVLRLYDLAGLKREPHSRDQGDKGRYNACHAEKQLIAYFVHKHLFLEDELQIPEEPGVRSLFSELGLGESAEQLRRKEEWQYKMRLVDLFKASPDNSLKEAKILVSRPICGGCKDFAKKVNHKLPRVETAAIPSLLGVVMYCVSELDLCTISRLAEMGRISTIVT